jgi:hypothetical protein
MGVYKDMISYYTSIKVHGRAKYKPVLGGSILSAVSLEAVAVF